MTDELEKGLGDWLQKQIQRTWQRIRARLFGPEGLSDAELAALGPIPPGEEPMLETAFRTAQQPDEPLTSEDQLVLEEARTRAGDLITGLAERHGADAARVLADVRAQVGESRVPKQLAADLREVAGDRMRDWDRVAVTELQAAKNEGRIAAIKRTSDVDDPIVFKTPAPDACSHCLRLHIGPDGNPRLFRLSSLPENNVGRSKANWQACRGPTHPHCGCPLGTVPRGWGFEDGDLVPGGKGGVLYEGDGVLEKALALEDDQQRAAHVGGRVDFQGLPVIVQANAGDVRKWRAPGGKTGRTVLRFAYGEIAGTVGADGDPVDVYLGPDPTSPVVFVVDQLKSDGSLDEQKVMLGFRSEAAARRAYLAHYPPSFLGDVRTLTVEAFQASLSVGAQIVKGDEASDNSSAYRTGTGYMDRAPTRSGAGVAALERTPRPAKPSEAMRELIEAKAAARRKRKRKIVPVVRLQGPPDGVRTVRSAKRPKSDAELRARESVRNLERVQKHAKTRRGFHPAPSD